MIEARVEAIGLTDRLAGRAEALALGAARDRLLAHRKDSSRWRRAALLWPLFARNR